MQSNSTSTLTLVKSKEILDKFTTRIANVESNRSNGKVIESIQYSSKKIQHSLDRKIQQNFATILNAPTLMPLTLLKADSLQKENNYPNNITALEGAKTLMYHYWERHKKIVNRNKTTSNTFLGEGGKSYGKLPNIVSSSNNDWKMGAFIRAKQKIEQFGLAQSPKQFQPKEEFHIKVKIIEYRCINQGKSFLKFQKIYYKRWQEIQSIIKALEKFAAHYQIKSLTILTSQIFKLINRIRDGRRISPHDLLGCCENAEKISEQKSKNQGIRFFGKSGKVRAIVVIQSGMRRWLSMRRYKLKLLQWRKAIKIQRIFRNLKIRKEFRSNLVQLQLKKLQNYNQIQKKFMQNYSQKQLSERMRYEIHIPSHNFSEWQKISTQKFIQKQNSELCRIFKVATENGIKDLRIIYISPISFSKDIINYFYKLLELGSEQRLNHKIIILSVENSNYMPLNLSLSQLLYYSPKTLDKIKRIVGNSYSYIVPSSPSNDYVHLCDYLNIPLYGGNPQKLAYLSTKSGCKNFQQKLKTESRGEGASILPYSVDIYNELSLMNELTNLIFRYPTVRRWILKIDNQNQSRGLAFIDVYKILGKKVKRAVQQPSKHFEKLRREEIYSALENSLIIKKQERVIPIDKTAYPTQSLFLEHFYTRGGVVEASINNFESDLNNSCFCVDLHPNGQWQFVCSYLKVTNQHRSIAAYYPSTSLQPPIEISQITKQLHKQHLFGYFTFQYLSINHHHDRGLKKVEDNVYYLNSIDCHINQFSSAHFLRHFISKTSNALYIPVIHHPALTQLRLQTFFHLCRLQNISFDIENKVGNIFTFIDGLQNGCVGIMTFNEQSKQHCYAHTAEVLQFLNSKLKQTNKLKTIPDSFLRIKNAVIGYLNRVKKMKQKKNSLN